MQFQGLFHLLTVLSSIVLCRTQLHYTPSDTCESDHICEYAYGVRMDQLKDHPITIALTVQIMCESRGSFGDTSATRYCMTVTGVGGNFLSYGNENDEVDIRMIRQSALEHLSGWFCFAQNSGGKVLSVFHSQSEEVEVVNIKKGIVAAFQANFKGTAEENEIDPQSRHTSHYSYKTTPEGATKMHRTFTSDDVIEYTMHIPRRKVQLVEEEDIEYRDGRLYKSNGTMHLSVDQAMPITDREEDNSIEDEDCPDVFNAYGSFTMELKVCRLVGRTSRKSRRAVQQSLTSDTSSEESLLASFDQKKSEMGTLAILHQQLQTTEQVIQALQSLNKTYSTIESAMVLEGKYTPLNALVTDSVLNYLSEISNQESEKHESQRIEIYSLLSAEGSPKSQHALVERLLSTEINEVEMDSLIVAIAYAQNPSTEFVQSLEMLITKTDGSTNLLLAYGALIANAAPDRELEMMSFLTKHMPDDMPGNYHLLIHFLHALGNTQSQLALEYILQYTQHSEETVRLTAVTAMRFFSNMPTVQGHLVDILINSNLSEAIVDSVIDTLRDGYDEHGEMNFNQELILTLANATVILGNDDLQMELVQLFVLVGTPDTLSMVDMIGAHSRQRRASTTDWDSTNSAYSALCPQYRRAEDVRNYPYHRGFLQAMNVGRDNGNYQFYLESAGGVFAGYNPNNNYIYDLKVVGKAYVRAHFFNSARDVLRAMGGYLKLNRQSSGKLKIYVKVGSSVLNNIDETVSTLFFTRSYPLPLYTRTLFSVSYRFRIYIVSVTLSASLRVSLGGTMVVSHDQSGGRVALIPVATAYADGSASADILLVKAGLTLTGSISYEMTVECSLNPRSWNGCISVYDEWPGALLTFYAYYQTRRTLWSSWRRKRTWDPLSFSLRLTSGSGRRLVHRSCL